MVPCWVVVVVLGRPGAFLQRPPAIKPKGSRKWSRRVRGTVMLLKWSERRSRAGGCCGAPGRCWCWWWPRLGLARAAGRGGKPLQTRAAIETGVRSGELAVLIRPRVSPNTSPVVRTPRLIVAGGRMHCALLERCCTAGRVFGRWRRCFELTSRVVRCFCGAAESRVSSGSGGNGRRDSGTAQARGRTVWMALESSHQKSVQTTAHLALPLNVQMQVIRSQMHRDWHQILVSRSGAGTQGGSGR